MSERKRLLFIYNPQSGRGLIKANLPKILDVFSASDYELIVHATQGPCDAKQIAEEYTGECKADRIICAGGDGTLDEVADGVMRGLSAQREVLNGAAVEAVPEEVTGALTGNGDNACKDEPGEPVRRIPIGIISAGSTNDFGYSLGIPSDIIEAAERAVSGRDFNCDIARFNGRHFTYTAAFGLLAEISYETPQEIKNALGYAAYILNGMMHLAEIRPIHARVTFDGETIEDDYLIGMVVSSNSVGGFRGITGEGVRLDDGKHELMLIRAPKKIGDLSKAINEVISHKYDGEYLKYFRAKNIHFEFDKEVAWSLDGENGGLWKQADIEVIRKGISYII